MRATRHLAPGSEIGWARLWRCHACGCRVYVGPDSAPTIFSARILLHQLFVHGGRPTSGTARWVQGVRSPERQSA